MSEQVTVLAGDGIGPEIIRSAITVLDEIGDFDFQEALIGGAAIDEFGDPFPLPTKRAVKASRAVLLGAVGGPAWESDDPKTPRPEAGLLALRRTLNTHANLRPIRSFDSSGSTPAGPDTAQDVDFVIVRELLGGIYVGKSGRSADTAYDVSSYSQRQIEAVGRTAFELALNRADTQGVPPTVTSVDKANVLQTSILWRQTMKNLQSEEYKDVELDHIYIDNMALQLVINPGKFKNVIVTDNMFGDILSDEAAWICGSLGLAPSASLNETGQGIFEPIHGSAPDIAGRGIANPIATILSAALALRYSLDMSEEALRIENAVEQTLQQGVRTPDLGGYATTEQVTAAVIQNLVD